MTANISMRIRIIALGGLLAALLIGAASVRRVLCLCYFSLEGDTR